MCVAYTQNEMVDGKHIKPKQTVFRGTFYPEIDPLIFKCCSCEHSE